MRVLPLLSFVLSVLLVSHTYAQPLAVKNTVRQTTAGAGVDTVRIGNVDCLVTPCGADIIDRAISQHPKIKVDGGLPEVEADGTRRNPSGNPVPVKVKARVGGAATAKIIGKVIAKQIPGIGLAIDIQQAAQEMGFNLERDSDGTVQVKKKDPMLCTVAPCPTVYTATLSAFNPSKTSTGSTAVAACAGLSGAGPSRGSPGHTLTITAVLSCGNIQYTSTQGSCCGGSMAAAVTSSVPLPVVAPWEPATQQEFLDAIAAKSGWPSTSKIGNALSVASQETGDAIEVIPSSQTTSGPASSPGTTSVTNNTTDNSTTTNTTTHNHSYAGDTITTNNSTTSITINNTTGAVTNSTTTTTNNSSSAPAPDVETCGLPGKPPCKLDETGTPVYDPEKFKLDTAKLDQEALDLRNKVKGAEDKGMFSNWGQFFSLPALRECEPLHLPEYYGYQLPSMDVCPGAEWLRNLMGFVWAVAGFAFCFKSVQDAI